MLLCYFSQVRDKIIDTIKSKFDINQVYLTKPVFFSRMTDKKAKTMHDEYWHEHVDKVNLNQTSSFNNQFYII